jgi:uncharacterized protein
MLLVHKRLETISNLAFVVINTYVQPKGQVPDYDEPVILRAEHPTIEEFCNRLHKGLLAEFSHAWVCKSNGTVS